MYGLRASSYVGIQDERRKKERRTWELKEN
jgi:hypothetical protein